MSKVMLFRMDDARQVLNMSRDAGIKYALDIVENDSSARESTKVRARKEIMKCRTPISLANLISGYILAHPTEGLKVL